jgi:hypothetical protein
LGIVWGVFPALPALLRGEYLGHGLTDLWPAVWGLWWSAEAWPEIPLETKLLGFPEGIRFLYSAPLKAWIGGLLVPSLGLRHTWNILLLGSRILTMVSAAWAARAWGLGPRGILCASAVFACSPFFHGYAVEGIVEGTDGWPLGLLVGALGYSRLTWAIPALALCVLTSWYQGAVGCLLVALVGLGQPRLWWSGLGVLLAVPAIHTFTGTFSGNEPLPAEVRAAMGSSLAVPRPGLLPGLNPFAMNSYVGFVLAGAAMFGNWRLVVVAMVPAILSLGVGPWYELPVFEKLRFPYRWHEATLAVLALAAGRLADCKKWGWWLGPFIVVEGLLLAPVEPVIPGADPEPPAACRLEKVLFAGGGGALLEVPGPVALPPGVPNPSRGRARELLYGQTCHGLPSPWVPDFNAIGVRDNPSWLQTLQRWDRVAKGRGGDVPEGLVADLRAAQVAWVLVHPQAPGLRDADRLREGLLSQGATLLVETSREDPKYDEVIWLFALREPTRGTEGG